VGRELVAWRRVKNRLSHWEVHTWKRNPLTFGFESERGQSFEFLQPVRLKAWNFLNQQAPLLESPEDIRK